eukprot:TRINITY_DN12181_c0_g1_i1.p1 TRINITY_DN12181_c0_g1~~TRINITY_DN12181_c0_g1_i1.p1  ORF type:complete len:247 (+),score=27.24 TRINITY_DN12181_c0_g1_i1:18-758(+)
MIQTKKFLYIKIFFSLVLIFSCYQFGKLFGNNTDYRFLVDIHDRNVSNKGQPWVEVKSWSPRVFLYHNFLSDEICDYFVELGKQKVTRSKVVGGKNSGPVTSDARTSDGAFLFMPDPVIRQVEKKIADWTHIPVDNGESFYILRYTEGQQYKPHNDYFSDSHLIGGKGNRMATVLLYLSTPEEGSGTIFPNINLEVPAKKGDAVLFYSLNPDGTSDPKSKHGGQPVAKGTKWAMTKWLRQGSSLLP